MGETLLEQNVWLAAAVCVLVYLLDYLLSHQETRLYREIQGRYLTIEEVYNESPTFDVKTGRPRLVNFRISAILVVMATGVYLVWLVSQRVQQPLVFSVLVGGLILMKLASMARRWRSISLYHGLQKEGGVSEHCEVSRRLYFTVMYNDLYNFTVLYFIVFVLTGSWFFIGGALTCLVAGRRWRDYTVITKYNAGM
jgi:hypothetical protein